MSSPRAMATRAGLILVLAFFFVALSGCGYAHKSTYPTGIRSVAVPIFKNKSFYQGAEFDVTEAVIKEIETRTPYKVVAEAGADTILEGTIVSIDQTRTARRREGGVPEELEFRVAVSYEWKNMQTGQVIRSRQGQEVIGRYIPSRPVSETYFTGQHEAAERIAQYVVSAMRADW